MISSKTELALYLFPCGFFKFRTSDKNIFSSSLSNILTDYTHKHTKNTVLKLFLNGNSIE